MCGVRSSAQTIEQHDVATYGCMPSPHEASVDGFPMVSSCAAILDATGICTLFINVHHASSCCPKRRARRRDDNADFVVDGVDGLDGDTTTGARGSSRIVNEPHFCFPASPFLTTLPTQRQRQLHSFSALWSNLLYSCDPQDHIGKTCYILHVGLSIDQCTGPSRVSESEAGSRSPAGDILNHATTSKCFDCDTQSCDGGELVVLLHHRQRRFRMLSVTCENPSDCTAWGCVWPHESFRTSIDSTVPSYNSLVGEGGFQHAIVQVHVSTRR